MIKAPAPEVLVIVAIATIQRTAAKFARRRRHTAGPRCHVDLPHPKEVADSIILVQRIHWHHR